MFVSLTVHKTPVIDILLDIHGNSFCFEVLQLQHVTNYLTNVGIDFQQQKFKSSITLKIVLIATKPNIPCGASTAVSATIINTLNRSICD